MSLNTAPTRVTQIECNLDDMTGEALGSMLDLLLEAGALDAWFVPIYMKQNRPAVTLAVLCAPEGAPRLRDLLLTHTSTLGVRWCEMERQVAPRHQITVDTPWGSVRCKVKSLPGQAPRPKPEYQDCLALARAHGIPWHIVQDAAYDAARQALAQTEE